MVSAARIRVSASIKRVIHPVDTLAGMSFPLLGSPRAEVITKFYLTYGVDLLVMTGSTFFPTYTVVRTIAYVSFSGVIMSVVWVGLGVVIFVRVR